MLPPPFANALILTGPTGSGKTNLGIDHAVRLSAEIISMDSMALYRGLDIGTAKPTAAERAAVRHHLIDVLEPWQSANVAWWLEQATAHCREIESRGKRVLFVGGTPLYLKALLCGLFDGPPGNPVRRRELEMEAVRLGSAALHKRLARIDPAAAARLHANDLRRVIRALETFELTGKPISEWQRQWPGDGQAAVDSGQSAGNLAYPSANSPQATTNGQRFPVLWLDLPRPELYDRINRRVEAMFAAGLVDEVRRLLAAPQPISKEAGQALGYKEVVAHLAGKQSLADTITLLQTRTRNFAKRQIAWFRHLPHCRPATYQLTWDLWHPTMK